MKKVKNLTENKDLINTFKKLKMRTNTSKSKLRKTYHYFFKFSKSTFIKIFFKSSNIHVTTFNNYDVTTNKNKFKFISRTNFLIQKNIMFLN